MAKVDLNKLDEYYDEEPVHVEKIKKKNKPSNPNKKHIKKDGKHKEDKYWRDSD